MTIQAERFYSPLIHVYLIAFTACLTYVENPLGGLSAYGKFEGVTLSIIVLYVVFYLFGVFICRYLIDNRENGQLSFLFNIEINYRHLIVVFVLAVLFQLYKFINIGDIPFLGNSMSRYSLTIGGLEDFPSRLLSPLSLVFYYAAKIKKQKSKLFYLLFTVAFTLNLLMMQRQEIMISLVGCVMIHNLGKILSFRKSITVFFCFFTLIYVVVGFGAIMRYGVAELSDSLNIFLISLWVIHLELVGAFVFGEHIVKQMHGDMFYGLYTFGDYFSLLGMRVGDHGASLLRGLYTTRDTAQSVGVPYGYYIDFNYLGVCAVGLLNGIIIGVAHRLFNVKSKNTFWSVVYFLIILNSLWSLRSGVFILNSLMLYILVAMFCVTKGGGWWVNFVRMITFYGFSCSILLSLLAVFIR